MPENWKTFQLGKIATLQRGFDLPTKKRISGNVPIVAASGIGGYHNQAKVKGPGVITGRSGTIGKVMFQKDDFWPLNTSLWVKDFHGNDVKFIYYLLSNFNFSGFNNGTSVPTLNRNDVHSVELNIPGIEEQKSIAFILSALDDKIELNLQMNKTLEEMAMALYKYWFVDFGPFQDGEFVDSELGEIPKGWEIKNLGDLLEHQKGFAFKSKWYQDEGKVVVRVSDTTEDSIDISTCNKISDEIASNYLKYSLKRNDIIIATVGSWPPNYASVVGKVIRVPPTAENGLLNQNAVKLNMYCKGEKQQGLLYTTLKANRFLNYIVNCAQGSASQASIKLTDIFNYPIPYNENIDLDIFTTEINSYINLQNSNIQENQTLTQLRDTLLPKLISGEVRVKDAEKTLSEVL